MRPFHDFALDSFWESSTYAEDSYVELPPTAEVIAAVERELGYTLPPAYIALAQTQNGGTPRRSNHRTNTGTTWAHDHIAISGIFGIGFTKRYSLCGQAGSKFWCDEWGYPPLGIYFADCPSAGHDMLCLDYSTCGPRGEPSVVHVDQEWDYKVTLVAPSFEAFVRGLQDDEAFSP